MADYDFRNLSSLDLEELVGDLLEAGLGLRLSRYGAGADGGIDLRHQWALDDSGLIVQCKHYAKSGYPALKSHLKTKELSKIKELAPDRYILATSVSMTPNREDELAELLKPHVHNKQDILGAEDLNSLLRLHPHVERAHFKLWMSSTDVLAQLINNDLAERTKDFMESVPADLEKFVKTGAVDRCQAALDDHHVCVISGPPGVGKTLLAKLLLAELAASAYEVVVVSSDIQEAERAFAAGRRQAFYYDDFLGATTLEDSLPRNEDGRLTAFMNKIARTSDKRLVMTTRSHLLRRARSRSEKLDRSDLEKREVVIEIGDYDTTARAKVLLNHLFFSERPPEDFGPFVEEERYWDVIDHRNYSPRLIEQIVLRSERDLVAPQEFADYFVRNLDKPTMLWTQAYEHQLADLAREALLVLFALGTGETLHRLQTVLLRGRDMNGVGDAVGMKSALRELEGTFIRIQVDPFEREDGIHRVRFANPSVQDFVEARLAESPAELEWLIHRAKSYDEIASLVRRARQSPDDVANQAGDETPPLADALLALRKPLMAAVELTILVPPATWPARSVFGWLGARTLEVFGSFEASELQAETVEGVRNQLRRLWESRSFGASGSDIRVFEWLLLRSDDLAIAMYAELVESAMGQLNDAEAFSRALSVLNLQRDSTEAQRKQLLDEFESFKTQEVARLSEKIEELYQYFEDDEVVVEEDDLAEIEADLSTLTQASDDLDAPRSELWGLESHLDEARELVQEHEPDHEPYRGGGSTDRADIDSMFRSL